MCSCHSILECCVTFSGVKLSVRSFVLFLFPLFWPVFVNWALVDTFRFISVPFDGSFWSISFFYIHFSALCVTVFTIFW